LSTTLHPSSDAGPFTIGVDLGQSRDPTAVAIVRTVRVAAAAPVYQVGHLERLPLNTPYPGVIRHVAALASRTQFRGAELILDYTGVGRPVFDLFRSSNMSPIGVSITAGDSVVRDGMVWKVPKIVLVSGLQAALHDGRLKIQKSLPEAPALVSELQDFRAEVTDSGYWKFGARSGRHDDLVLALAIAVWRASQKKKPMRISDAAVAMWGPPRSGRSYATQETGIDGFGPPRGGWPKVFFK